MFFNIYINITQFFNILNIIQLITMSVCSCSKGLRQGEEYSRLLSRSKYIPCS